VIYPRDLDTSALRDLDHVHVASPTVAADLAADGVRASLLPQATDTERFRPTPGGRHHELLFVANSRNVRRRITDDLLPTDHELAIYGYGWTPELVDVRHVVADQVPNAQLPALYTAADLVLNDHWDEMRAGAYLSNRLFDAAACGATVVTDRIAGLDEVFHGTVTAYRDRDDLHRIVDELLADAGRRRELGDRARELVVAGHTFDHRVEALLASLPASLPRAPRDRPVRSQP
jgi:O-antigen biosynthesis protein